MATFLDLAKRIEKKERDLALSGDAAKRAAVMAFVNEVAVSTPSVTGEHVSSWQVGIGRPAEGHREPFVEGDADANARLVVEAARRSLRASRPGTPVYISNSAPAIVMLNEGFSDQEPAGFVERALLKARLAVERIRTGGYRP